MDRIYDSFEPPVLKRGEGEFSVSVWGRTYTFKNSFLFTIFAVK